ncbi:hypothetical protein Tco_0645862 [Tanacetum coccineum]
MIKDHDQQAKIKATPRKLAYADSDKEAPALSLAKRFSDRFSLESSGTSDTYRQTRSASKNQKFPSKNKESTHLRRSRRLEDMSMTKEKVRKERSKSRRKRSRHQEASSSSEYEEGSKDAYEDLNSPYKRPKPAPFTQRITRFKYHRRAKLLRNIRVYEGNKDPEDHLGIFLATAEQEEWLMLAKDPTEIYGIKKRQNKGLQAFVDRFKSESSHIKGVPPVLRISAFMHGHGHPKLVKKLNDKIPKMVDEMFERVKEFIRGEVAVGSAEMVRPSQRDKGGIRRLSLKRYFHLAYQDSKRDPRHGKILSPLPLIGTPEKQNLNKFCDYHGDIVKDIHQNNQQNGNQGRNGVKIINMIREEGNHKRTFEEGRSGLMNELTFPVIPQSQLTDEPIILKGIVEGNRVRRILVDGGSSSEIMYEHCFRNLDINVRLRLKRVQGSWKEVQWHQRKEQMSRIRKQAILRARSNSRRRPGLGLVSLEKTRSKDDIEEVFTISHERPNQYVMMGAMLTTNCKQLLADILRENMELFAWTRSESTVVSRFVMEHQLKIYPLVELVIHKRQPVAPEGRLALKERMDYSSLNKACSKDMYPFSEEGEDLASLMGYLYK